MAKDFDVKITSAVVIDGSVQRPGTKLTLPLRLVRNLLDRGKAELVVGQELPVADGPIGTDGKGGAKRQGKKPADEKAE